MVVTYDNGHVFKTGRGVKSKTVLDYSGDLICAASDSGKVSKYIPRHQCIVRVGDALKTKHIVYMMQRGSNFRIGKVPYFYDSQNGVFGLGLRASAEKADKAWVLSVHDTHEGALLSEALYQVKHGIPGVCFIQSLKHTVSPDVFWEAIGDNTANALICLEAFDLLFDMPLWTSGTDNLVGVRRPFVTAASNLHDGMMMLPLDENIPHKKSYVNCWELIKVSRKKYDGYVYSLEVEEHHTYFADGLLTHNSWRGAKNAMTTVPHDHATNLSRSFRFGQPIADVANDILQKYTADDEYPIKIVGNPNQQSTVEEIHGCPDAIICRTNGGVIGHIFQYIEDHNVYLQGGATALTSLIKGADALKHGRKTANQELALFNDWDEVMEYSKSSSDGKSLAVMIKLMDNYGANTLMDLLKQTVSSPRQADITLTTAHKAKGLEWNKVKLGDDFFYPSKEGQYLASGEVNVLYVGATRALKQLDITRCTAANVDKVLANLEKE